MNDYITIYLIQFINNNNNNLFLFGLSLFTLIP